MTRFQTTYNRYFGKDRIESIQKAGLRETFYYHYDCGIASDEEKDDVSHNYSSFDSIHKDFLGPCRGARSAAHDLLWIIMPSLRVFTDLT